MKHSAIRSHRHRRHTSTPIGKIRDAPPTRGPGSSHERPVKLLPSFRAWTRLTLRCTTLSFTSLTHHAGEGGEGIHAAGGECRNQCNNKPRTVPLLSPCPTAGLVSQLGQAPPWTARSVLRGPSFETSTLLRQLPLRCSNLQHSIGCTARHAGKW